MYSELDTLFQKLSSSKFRSKFRLNYEDRQFAQTRDSSILRQHALDLINKRLAPSHPINDGRQTPMKGHPIFTAQHATGCCCRGCLQKWHDIPKGRKLTSEEVDYIVDILMEWVRRDLEQEAPKRRIKKGETLPLL